MLVNSQKSGIMVRVAIKTAHIKVLSHTTNPKTQYFATTTLKFLLAKCSVTISNVCSHPTGPRQLAPTQQDRATETRNQHLRPKSQSKTVYHTEMKQRSGHLGSRPVPAHYYRVFCRQQVQDAAGQCLSPHPETEASGNHKHEIE